MAIILGDVPEVSAGDTEIGAVDFQDWLDGTELLTGTPTVAEQVTSALTIDNVGRNSATLTIKGRSVTANKAVQFRFSGQVAGTTYRLRVTCGTDATPARTVQRDVTFKTV